MKKVVIISFFGLGGLIATTMYFNNAEDSQASLVQEPDKPVEQAEPAQEVSTTGPVSREQDLLTEQEKEDTGQNVDQEIRDAHAAHSEQLDRIGYHRAEEFEDYRHYPIEALEELLSAGDTRAYPALRERYSEAGELEKIASAARVAAIHGSTPAITTLAGLAATEGDVARRTEGQDPAKSLIFSQALFRLATSLGDPYSESAAKDSLERFDVEFTEEQLEQVEHLAVEVEEHLNNIRREKGLEDFEKASEAVNQYHEALMTMD